MICGKILINCLKVVLHCCCVSDTRPFPPIYNLRIFDVKKPIVCFPEKFVLSFVSDTTYSKLRHN